MTGADSLNWNLDVSSQSGQRFTLSDVARHDPQQVDSHAMSQEFQDQHCPYAPHVRIPAPGRGAALPILEGAMAARKILAHCSRQNVTSGAVVQQATFLLEVSHERLVDLCVRDEWIVCHQGALEKLLQGPVVTNGVFHCVEFRNVSPSPLGWR